MGVAADFVTKFVEPLDGFMTETVSKLAGALEGPLYAGATLYIVIFGILVVLGYVRAPIQDFVINVIKIAIIVALVTEVSTYNQYVKDFFFTQLPDGIGAAFGTQGTAPGDIQSGSAFDSLIDDVLARFKEIASEGSWRNIVPYLIGSLFVVVGVIASIILLALVLLAKLALALLIAIGPIFIALALFRATFPFFSSWLSGLVNFVVLQVLVVAIISLLVSILTGFLNDISGADFGAQMAMALRMVALFALGAILALQLPGIAARISGGGIELGTGLIRSGAQGAMKLATKGISGLGGLGRGRGSNTISQG